MSFNRIGFSGITMKLFCLAVRMLLNYLNSSQLKYPSLWFLLIMLKELFQNREHRYFLFKKINGIVRTLGKTCAKLTIKIPERSLLTLNRFYTLFGCFRCWLWTSKYRLRVSIKIELLQNIAKIEIKGNIDLKKGSQLTLTCSLSTIETLENCVKYVQKYTIKSTERWRRCECYLG